MQYNSVIHCMAHEFHARHWICIFTCTEVQDVIIEAAKTGAFEDFFFLMYSSSEQVKQFHVCNPPSSF